MDVEKDYFRFRTTSRKVARGICTLVGLWGWREGRWLERPCGAREGQTVGGLQTHVWLHDGADHRPHPRGVKGGEFVGVL